MLAVAIVVACYVALQVMLTLGLGLKVTPEHPSGLQRKRLVLCLALPPLALLVMLLLAALWIYQGYCAGGPQGMSYACGRGDYLLSALSWVVPMVALPALIGWALCGVAIGYAAWVRRG